jgi:hypothetical protein
MADEATEGIDYKNAIVGARDPANRAIVDRRNPKTFKLGMCPTDANAMWAAERGCRFESYPLATLRFPVNRKGWRHEVGDLINVFYGPKNLQNMVLRIMLITEENPESENLSITALEDIDYLAAEIVVDQPVASYGDRQSFITEKLTCYIVDEAPYDLAGDAVRIVCAAGRKRRTDKGFKVTKSSDDSSYLPLGDVLTFAICGELVEAYPVDTLKIDGDGPTWQDDPGDGRTPLRQGVGIIVDFPQQDSLDRLSTIARGELFGLTNMAVIGGSEIITFQKVTPNYGGTERRYKFEGILRGQYDTEQISHNAGAQFIHLDNGYWKSFVDTSFLIGTTRYFKYYAFSSSQLHDDADSQPLYIQGRARKPYKPSNLSANDQFFKPRYTGDIDLEWWPRIRGDGAGYGDADSVTDASPTWEGLFRVIVSVGGSVVRTVTALNARTWTYTAAMNVADNGALASEVSFTVANYLTVGGVPLYSPSASITVEKS